MAMVFATGKYAFGICGRCGIRCRYTEMRAQPVNGLVTNLRVCPECLDIDTVESVVRARITALLGAEGIRLEFPRPEPPEFLTRPAAPDFTYYVDPVAGSDHALGTSVNTAWRTTARADTIRLTGGHTVGYKYAGEWYLYRKVGMSSAEALLPSDIYTGESGQF